MLINSFPAILSYPKLIFISGCDGKPADVFFLLDSSSSIWIMDYKKQLKFVANIIDSFQISDGKTRVAAGVFSDKYSLEIPFGDYNDTDDLKHKIQNLPYLTGGTKTHIALRRMREEAFSNARPGVAHIAVILTDGRSEYFSQTVKEAALLHKQGIYVFAVGIGRSISYRELKAMGSDPAEEFVFRVASFNMLDTIRETLAYSACKGKFERFVVVASVLVRGLRLLHESSHF